MCNHNSLYPKIGLAVVRNARDSQQVERVRLLAKEKAFAHLLLLSHYLVGTRLDPLS